MKKIRQRAPTKSVLKVRNGLYEIVAEQQPMTVRQAYYQATVRGLIEKTTNGYNLVKYHLGTMREEG